jgi:hypothetical protein
MTRAGEILWWVACAAVGLLLCAWALGWLDGCGASCYRSLCRQSNSTRQSRRVQLEMVPAARVALSTFGSWP